MAKSTGELFEELVAIMARLRNPEGGCPWDLEQNHVTLKPYVIEEAYEVVDAIDSSREKLPEELGDLLLQVVFHAQLAREEGTFDIQAIIKAICEKLIRRHPHVFGDTKVAGADQVLQNWEQIKQNEHETKKSALHGVPHSMPALLRAQRLGEKAARIGFDWHDTQGVKAKVFEEIREFLDEEEKIRGNAQSIGSEQARKKAGEEFGDLLFALSQWARKAGLNAEDLLRQAGDKFEKRFKAMEALVERPLKEHSAPELDELWEQIKAKERGSRQGS